MISYEDFVVKLREMLRKRIAMHPNDYAIILSWKEQTKFCSDNIEHIIKFIDEESSEDEYGWLSEIFEDIAEANPNKEFVACLYRAAEKYPKETKECNVMSFIVTADAIVQSRLDDDSDSEE